ncbi:MAG TPA: AfsR/SARP family transcriptional regulator [Gaiellaceae bacterium]|nr:AfsR/SARP family transcriptional regulator [Gaiellaceae bacterium]
MLDFRILGPLEVVADHGPVRLGGPKQRATLAILLLNANRVVSVDRLADDLYAGAAPVTAVTQVQRQISELRKLLGAEHTVETRPPGYVLRLVAGQLDLQRFERITAEATMSFDAGEPRRASDLLREALALWRGPALADVAYESFARPAVERLEEIRLAALEQRIDADLALGRDTELVGELEQLVGEHQLHEHFCAQLMLALYRAGRQSEALDVYRGLRARLVELLGLEPTPALQGLERAILAHDASLAVGRVGQKLGSAAVGRAVLVVASAADRLDALLSVAEPLAASRRRELIVVRLLEDERDLEREARSANARRPSLRAGTRTAVFTTLDPARDVLRLANATDAGVVLVDGPEGLDADRVPEALRAMLESSPANVGVLAARDGASETGAGVFVPFGGGEHDWAALELGAWLASASGTPLCLVGTKADVPSGRRDASRLLADASLAVQRVVGVDTRPVLAEPTEDALVAAVGDATLVVAGVSPRWHGEGIGDTRRALVRKAQPPVLLVHRGPRPSGLAPGESRTRFSWTLGS